MYLYVYLQTQKVKIPQSVPYTGFGWLCDIVALATKQKWARKYPNSEDAQKKFMPKVIYRASEECHRCVEEIIAKSVYRKDWQKLKLSLFAEHMRIVCNRKLRAF